MGRAAKAPSRRDADSRLRLGVAAGRRALIRPLSTFFLIAAVCPGVQPQAAERLDEDLRERLLQLKQLCDEGLVDMEVCKEKQRQILGLPAPASGTQPIEPATSRQAPEPRRGFLGIVVDSLVEEGDAAQGEAARLGLVVTRVLEGGPAEQAGLQVGDVILELTGQAVGSAEELAALEAGLVPSAKTTLKVSRQPGKEITLEATAIDRQQYPPARTHKSRLGFNIDIPAGWTVVQGADYEAVLEAFGDRIGSSQQKSIVSELVMKIASIIDVFVRDRSTVRVMKHSLEFPASASAARRMCAQLDAGGPKSGVAYGRLRNCRLRTVSEVVVFCMDQDSTKANEALRHCWVKGPAEENAQLSLTFDPRSGADDLEDLDKMLASVAWR